MFVYLRNDGNLENGPSLHRGVLAQAESAEEPDTKPKSKLKLNPKLNPKPNPKLKQTRAGSAHLITARNASTGKPLEILQASPALTADEMHTGVPRS